MRDCNGYPAAAYWEELKGGRWNLFLRETEPRGVIVESPTPPVDLVFFVFNVVAELRPNSYLNTTVSVGVVGLCEWQHEFCMALGRDCVCICCK